MPKDPRGYITVHNGMPDHPKVEGLSNAAFRLLITWWCWCARHLTDGFVPAKSWNLRGTSKVRCELLSAGLVEEVADGVRMHDYMEHQQSSAAVTELRTKRAMAGRQGGLAKAAKQVANARDGASEDAKQSANTFAKQTESKHVPEGEGEGEGDKLDKSSLEGPRKRGSRLPDDWMPSQETRDQMASEHPTVDLRSEHAKFCDYWRAKSGKDATKLDWDATWRNWIRRAESDRKPSPAAASRPWTPEPPPAEIADDVEACDRWYRDQAAKRVQA